MVVSPTLFGLTHDELTQEERDREEAKRETGGESCANPRVNPLTRLALVAPSAADNTPRVRKVTFVDEDDPFRVASSNRPPIAKMSSNAWVACGGDRYVLELLGE
jgi:ATP-dependent helicase IRC3